MEVPTPAQKMNFVGTCSRVTDRWTSCRKKAKTAASDLVAKGAEQGGDSPF